MGYVHDTAMSDWLSPDQATFSAGTWTGIATSGSVSGPGKTCSIGDNTYAIDIPIVLPSNSVALKGSKITSIDLFYNITGAAMDAVTATLWKTTLPALTSGSGVAASSGSVAVTEDTNNDTAAERKALGQHKHTLTLTTPVWIDNDEIFWVELIADGASSSVFTFYGARVNYTLRL